VFKIVYSGEKSAANPTTIGQCGLTKTQDSSYEVGYWLHSDYAGKGITTEYVERLISFARDELNANRLTAVFMKRNVGSRRVAEKTGFHFVKSEISTFDKRPDWGEIEEQYYELIL